ncbi:hypothetical protein BDQ12DRAFT_636226 [Crucibulum laeve]|uniref:Uncharacterized protein n=1 Tax=Crucibulum laeve TaxID=68775 RepID=A0A5C3LQE6_9AGAR|nr:hypothetical protein BDQ12DRAFT_636226 [Crucibulum laeve]
MDMRTTIRSLPNELLEIIFEHGSSSSLPMAEQYPLLPLFSKFPLSPLFPTALSQVCHRWRCLALNMPSLWRYIHVTRSAESHRRLKSDLRRSLEWVSIYLHRSEGLPLRIVLDCTHLPIASAMSLIIVASRRWHSLTILVSHVGTLSPVLSSFRSTPVPQLEYLTVAADIYREGIISTQPLPAFFTAGTPQLVSLRLKGVYLAWNGPPLTGLVTLELRFTTRWPSFNELRDMFAASPLLRRLVIQDDIGSIVRNVAQPDSKSIIDLPHLQSLSIQIYRVRQGDADVTPLLKLFSMPMLETLSLQGLRALEWVRVTHHFKMLKDTVNFPSIKTLHLLDVQGQIQTNVAMCEAFPRLSTLKLTQASSKAFLELMLEDAEHMNHWKLPIWPNLTRMIIHGDENFSLPLLQSVVNFRQALHRPSLTLALDEAYLQDQKRMDWLKRFSTLSLAED